MSCLLAAFAYSIHHVSLVFLVLSWHTASVVSSLSCWSFCNVQKPCTCVVLSSPVQYLERPSSMQTVVSCFPNLAGPSWMPWSLHWIFFHSYYILLIDIWLMIGCKCWYDVIHIIPWIIPKQLWMVIFFLFCMNFELSCT